MLRTQRLAYYTFSLLIVKRILHATITLQILNYETLLNSNNDKAIFWLRISYYFRRFPALLNRGIDEKYIFRISCSYYIFCIICVVKNIAKKRRWIICRRQYVSYIFYEGLNNTLVFRPCSALKMYLYSLFKNLLNWCSTVYIYAPLLISFIILCPYGDNISTSRICRYKRTIKMSKVFIYRQVSDKISYS